MKIVLDTNVFVSGIFFSGPPYQILKGWQAGALTLVLSAEILDEYRRVASILAEERPPVAFETMIALVEQKAEFCNAPQLPEQVCDDPDDDKFLACAIASNAKIVVSGDKHLLRVSGFHEIEVIKPRTFVDGYLS